MVGMQMRFYRVNAFLVPSLDWLVPGWRIAVATDTCRSASGDYSGPLYLLLTDYDAVLLARNGPEDEPGALDIISRFPLEGRIRPETAAGELRRAVPAERAEALRRLQLAAGGGVAPFSDVWMTGQVGFCIHEEPWLASLFQFRDGRCTDVVFSTPAQRIVPLAEE